MKKQIIHDKKIRIQVKKAQDKRIALKTIQKSSFFTFNQRYVTNFMFSRLKSNSFPNRIRNRCILTGRGRGVHRFFKLSRILIKDLAAQGQLPGVMKAC